MEVDSLTVLSLGFAKAHWRHQPGNVVSATSGRCNTWNASLVFPCLHGCSYWHFFSCLTVLFQPGKMSYPLFRLCSFPSVPPSTRAGEQGHLHGSLEALGFRLSLVFIVHSSSPAAPAHTRYWKCFYCVELTGAMCLLPIRVRGS